MVVRRLFVFLALLFVVACESSGPPTGLDEPAGPSFVLLDGTTTGNPHFYILPPLVPDPTFTGPFDGTLRPRVEICEWSGGTPCSGPPVFTFTMSSGTGGERLQVSLEDEHYKVNWDLGAEGVDPGDVFRIRVFLVSLELGSVDVEIGEDGRDVQNINTGDNIGLVDDSTLPLRFRIEEGAVSEAETEAEQECLDESGNVVDCDVVLVDAEEGATATVQEDPGGENETLAAIVTIPPGDAVDADGNEVSDFVLTLKHVTSEPAPPGDVPTEQQIPFFIDVTALDADGDPVFFQTGAEVVLCQPPDLSDPQADPSIPDALHQFLTLFQVKSGVTQFLPTTLDNQANCPSGLHGGLNTLGVDSFSGFGAALPTDPGASTAEVPDGTVGTPTVIDIQAKVDASNHQIFGGDEVVVTITGANPGSATVVDNGDGTYTAGYTPTETGTDMITIEIRNVVTGDLEPISGSPFTSTVTSPAPTLLEPTAGTVIPQNDPTIGCTLILENGRGFGFEIFFDWTDVPGADSYEIVAGFPSAAIPFVDQTVTQSELRDTNCNAIAGTSEPAEWQVRAITGGVAGPWSAVETFEFADCVLEDGSPCVADTAPIGFEVLPDGSSPTPGMSITVEYGSLGVEFSYVAFDEGSGTPRLCDSTPWSPPGVLSDHSVTFHDASGSGSCTPATLGTITMAFSATTTAVEFRLAYPQGATPDLAAQSKGGAPLTPTLLSSTDYTAQNSIAMTEDVYRVSGDVGFIDVAQGLGGAIMLIDGVHLLQ